MATVNTIEAFLRRLPFVGRYAHVIYLVVSFGLFQALGLSLQRLLIFPLVKQSLGARVFGSFLLAYSFATFGQMIASAGQSAAMLRFHSLREPQERPALYATGLVITLLIGVVLAAVLLGATPILRISYNADVAVFTAILAAYVVMGAGVSYLSMVLRARLQIILSAALENLCPLLSGIMIFLVWAAGDVGAPVAACVAMAWTLAVIVWALDKVGAWPRRISISRQDVRMYVTTGPLFALSGLAASASIMAGRWFIGYYCEPESVTHYYVASTFALLMIMPIGHVSVVLFPLVCSRRDLADFSSRTLKYYYMLCLALVPIVFLGGWFVARPLMILYGRDTLVRSEELLVYILIGVALDVCALFARSFILKFCSVNTICWLQIVPFAVNVCLNVWLVPRYGVMGGAWALGASMGLRGILAALIITHLFFGRRRSRGVPVPSDTVR